MLSLHATNAHTTATKMSIQGTKEGKKQDEKERMGRLTDPATFSEARGTIKTVNQCSTDCSKCWHALRSNMLTNHATREYETQKGES